MVTINRILDNPRKSLTDLEKELGAEPGQLLREMRELADEQGDWRDHLPSSLAAGYFDDPSAQRLYGAHVDTCSQCQSLLDTVHPTDVEAQLFVNHARRTQPETQAPPQWSAHLLTGAASMLVTAFACLFVIPQWRHKGLDDKLAERVVIELRQRPDELARLEGSDQPLDRYAAAKYYFAMDKPQLAFQQIGQGLQLAGVHPVDAQKITTAADVPASKSVAADIAKTAQSLPHLKASAHSSDPADYLEVAEAQAKLGLNQEALVSIQRYLKARKVDPKTLADFSNVALVEPFTTVADNEP